MWRLPGGACESWDFGFDLFLVDLDGFVLGDLLQLFVSGRVLDWSKNEYTACLTCGRLLD